MMDDKLLAAREMAKLVFLTNAEEAERAGKHHIGTSERSLTAMVDSGDLDEGHTIPRLLKDWQA